MKNYLILMFSVLVLFTTSCEKEAENWSTKAVDYAGKFITAGYDANGQVVAYYNTNKTAIYISNTASDLEDQIFIKANYLKINNIFDISGTPADFKSKDLSFASCHNNITAVAPPALNPVSENETKVLTKVPDVRCAIISAKIGDGDYTTPSGNVTDKVELKLKTFGGKLTFKSEVKPEDQWVKPGVPDYVWVLDNVEADSSVDGEYTIEGFRHTGFHEDDLR